MWGYLRPVTLCMPCKIHSPQPHGFIPVMNISDLWNAPELVSSSDLWLRSDAAVTSFTQTPSTRVLHEHRLPLSRPSCPFAAGIGSRAALPMAESPPKAIRPQSRPVIMAASTRCRSGYPLDDTSHTAASSPRPNTAAARLRLAGHRLWERNGLFVLCSSYGGCYGNGFSSAGSVLLWYL